MTKEETAEYNRKYYQKNKEELENMSKKQAVDAISNSVYEACGLFESLEAVAKINGNGHHMMQKVSTFAEDLMKEKWG